MAGFTQARQRAILDAEYPVAGSTDHVAYSTNGTTETGILARTAIGATGWAAATATNPSLKANVNALTSVAATGAGTITHFAVFSASAGGTQKTDWEPLATARPIVASDTIGWSPGGVAISLD